MSTHNSFLAISNFCRLMKTFANSLGPDQDRQEVGPGLKEYFEKVNFEKSQITTKQEILPSRQRDSICYMAK